MIRNLKVLVLAAFAVAALGALTASAAQAEPTFTNNAEGEAQITYKIKPDGTGKTAHVVLEIKKADGTGLLSMTCNELAGDATVAANERNDATFVTPEIKGGCVFAGQPTTVQNTGCNFTFTANNQIHLENESALNICEVGQKPIHFSMINCKVEIGGQTLNGINYHNMAGGKITVEVKELAFEYYASGTACPYGTTKNGSLTTANFILEGTKKGTEELVEISWDE
jgi:hypothetical protein